MSGALSATCALQIDVPTMQTPSLPAPTFVVGNAIVVMLASAGSIVPVKRVMNVPAEWLERQDERVASLASSTSP